MRDNGGELSFALGVTVSVSRLGSVFNTTISPKLAQSGGVGWALWSGAIMHAVCSLPDRCGLYGLSSQVHMALVLHGWYMEQTANGARSCVIFFNVF